MSRNYLLAGLMVLGLSVGLVGQALAQDINDTSWLATYWNNETLSGDPELQRQEANIDYNWGADSPAPEVSSDSFSARWQRYLNVEPATYRFTATSDDGMRVWIDGNLIIDEWSDHPVKTVSADVRLTGGRRLIVVEYYEDGGGAIARLTWQPVSAPGNNWLGEYFNNRDLEGDPRLARYDAQISFNWGPNSPAPDEIDSDDFSVRWTQNLNLPAGLYRFIMTVDDGGRLWVNNFRLIDQWRVQSPSTYSADINLPGGSVPVVMEYFEGEGGAIAQLRWEALGGATEPPVIQNWRGEYFDNSSLRGNPTLIRDDQDINFEWGLNSPRSPLVPSDQFSVRWTRTVDLKSTPYCFIMTVDDGGRLWVNNNLIIDGWKVQQPQNYATAVAVPGGPTSIRMEYFDSTGGAVAKLQWLETTSGSLRNVRCD